MAEGAAQATKAVPGAVGRAPAARQATAQARVARRVFSEPGEAAERSAGARSLRAMSRSASTVGSGFALQRACACGGKSGERECDARPSRVLFEQRGDASSILRLQRTIGNRAVQSLLSAQSQNLGSVRQRAFVQSSTNHEQETTTAIALRSAGPRVGVEPDTDPIAPIADAVRRGEGEPLPHELQADWGGRLGRDLGAIRLHTDRETAAAVVRSGTNALSFGPHVFFAPGRYDLRAEAGRRLLGHELAHALETDASASLRVRVRPDPDADRLQPRADALGASLASGQGPVAAPAADHAPALRGDKRIAFGAAKTITVTDEYVLYGPAANAAVLATVQSALQTYYNGPAFTYRGYKVVFKLTARLATPGEWRMFNSTTTWINVESALPGKREGGLFTTTIFDTSTADAIAHEVGHKLSDRIGLFSEGYHENFFERAKYFFGLGPGGEASVKPEAKGDIMSDLDPGDVVSTFSLSGILDVAIDAHERPLGLTQLERRGRLYVDMITQARAEQFYLSFVTSSDTAREQMGEVFAETNTRLPPVEAARLGANGSVFASPKVRG